MVVHEMNKKLLVTIPIILLVLLLVSNFSTSIKLMVSWSADSYGNDIRYIEVFQNSSGTFTLFANFTASGQSQDGLAIGQAINFEVYIKFKFSLANNNNSTALTYTRCNMTIAYENGTKVTDWNNKALSQSTHYYNDSTYWYNYLYGNWTAELPIATQIYNVTTVYEGYY